MKNNVLTCVLLCFLCAFLNLGLAQSATIEKIQVNPNGNDGNEPCFIITCEATVNGMLGQGVLFYCHIFTYKNENWEAVPDGYQQLTATATYESTVWNQITFALRKAFFLEKLGKEAQTLAAVISVKKAEDGSEIHQKSSETFAWDQNVWEGQTPAPEDLLREGNQRTNYTVTPEEAYQAYSEKQYAKAARLYVSLIKQGNTHTDHYYNAACCFALDKNLDSAFEYLDEAIQNGYNDFKHLQQDSDLNSLHADERWEAILKKFQKESSKETPKNSSNNFPSTSSVKDIPVFKTKTKTIKSFGFFLEIPESWQEKKEHALFFTFKAVRVLSKTLTASHPVFCQFLLKKPEAPIEYLQQSIIGGLNKVSDYKITGNTSFKIIGSQTWKLPSGKNGYMLSLSVLKDSKVVGGSCLAGVMICGEDCAFLLGSVAGFSQETNNKQEGDRVQVWKDFPKFTQEEVFCAVARCQIALPPVNESWTKWLVNKKSYLYEYESSSYIETIAGPVSTGSHNIAGWTFYPDRTCDFQGKDFFGFSGSTFNDQSHSDLATIFAGDENGNKTFTKRRFEVRGSNDNDLWIVVYHKNGFNTIHRIEPNKKVATRWTDSEMRGLAIDGEVEGYYLVANGVGCYKKTK